jgi:TonB-linked SusC/RagA family outer membrane protein
MNSIRWLCALVLVIALIPTSAMAQEAMRISGRVVAEAGQPLASASVLVPALSIGTLTRADGTYLLIIPAGRVPAGGQVQVSAQLIGYRAQSATVTLMPGAAVTQSFQLTTDVLQLEGIVATGIGQVTTRERLGVSINSISSDQITRAPAPNLVQAMAGKAPNVEITSMSGEPGAASYIRIRGTNTIGGSGQPLFVIDGVPLDNSQIGQSLAGTASPNRASDINPNDVESIEILKGAAAAAIYGARAANGVVLVTTKSGQAGVTRASLTSTVTIDQVTQGVPLQRRFGQGVSGASSETHPFSWGPQLAANTPTFDHFGVMFRDGQMFENNLSLSGGSDRTKYFLSVGRMDHEGTIVGPNNWYDRTTARLRASHRLAEALTVGGNFNYVQTRGAFIQKGSNLSGLLLGSLRSPPEFDNRNYLTEGGLHRSYRVKNPTVLAASRGYDNPFFIVNEHQNDRETGRAFGNITLDYVPIPWLTLNYTIGNDYWSDEVQNALPPSSSDWAPGRIERGQYTFQQLDHNLVGTATHTLRPGIGGSLTLGANRNARSFRQLDFDGYNFVAPSVFSLNNMVTLESNEFRSEIRSESFFGQVQADLFDQLFLTAAARNDGFSTFGQNDRRHWFPKASAAWEFTRTLGFDRGQHPVLGFGKLRAAWGQAGNEPGVYQTITAFATGNFFDGGWGPFLNPVTFNQRGGLYTSVLLGQDALRPERTTEREVGVDLSLLRDVVGFEFTYYNAITREAIFSTPLAPSTGFTSQVQNAATIRNEGIEVQMDVRALQRPNFSWEIGGQFGRNNNRVLDLGDPDREFVPMGGAFAGAPGAAVVGERAGVIRGNDFYRCGRAGLPEAVMAGCQGAPAGAVYVAASGFPLVDPEVRVIGDPHPDWTMGIRNSITLMNRVTVTGLVDIRRGGDLWNGTRGALYHFGTHADTDRRGEEATYGAFSGQPVAGPGAERVVTFGQGWFTGLGSGFGQVASQFIEDGSYVKLREIGVSYEVPADFSQRLGMSGINLRLAGRNLATWTDYTGIDPETNLAGNTNLRGIDYFNNPQTRSWVFTVGLNR